MPNEEYALVLDYMHKGKSSSFKEEAIAQVIGTEMFSLLEVTPKEELKAMEKVFVGKEGRTKIEFIKRRINYSDLTSNAMAELPNAIDKIIEENSQKYLDFYNKSGSITIRRHQLELLPTVGAKHVKNILQAREEKEFESFKEIQERVPLMPDPKKAIAKRITYELEGFDVKYYLFTRPPKQEKFYRK